jgi:hypothetical protein
VRFKKGWYGSHVNFFCSPASKLKTFFIPNAKND